MGFAPPPYDGFALLASVHTRMRIPCYAHHTWVRSPTQYSLEDVFLM
jgi:hypothetical protein